MIAHVLTQLAHTHRFVLMKGIAMLLICSLGVHSIPSCELHLTALMLPIE